MSRLRNATGNPGRDALLRESHRLNHELGYIGFRHRYFNDPDEIREWPDPAVREQELRSFWDKEMQGNYASYLKDFSHYSVGVLAAYCDYLRELLDGDKDAQIAYYHQVSEMGRERRLQENGISKINATEGRLPSPGEIARDNRPAAEEQGQGHDNGRQEERGRGR